MSVLQSFRHLQSWRLRLYSLGFRKSTEVNLQAIEMQIIHYCGANTEIKFHRWLLFPPFLRAAEFSIYLVFFKKTQVTLFKDLYLQNQYICQLLHKLICVWNIYSMAEKQSVSGVLCVIIKLSCSENVLFSFLHFAEKPETISSNHIISF